MGVERPREVGDLTRFRPVELRARVECDRNLGLQGDRSVEEHGRGAQLGGVPGRRYVGREEGRDRSECEHEAEVANADGERAAA